MFFFRQEDACRNRCVIVACFFSLLVLYVFVFVFLKINKREAIMNMDAMGLHEYFGKSLDWVVGTRGNRPTD